MSSFNPMLEEDDNADFCLRINDFYSICMIIRGMSILILDISGVCFRHGATECGPKKEIT